MLDRGGPAERANQAGIAPAFVFAEMVSPEFVRDDWTPEYIDYLWLAFTNATAFSPTDTMPVTHWAKMLMFFQAADLARGRRDGHRPGGEHPELISRTL